MSLSTDVLSRATPTRLVCRGGRWVLEMTGLEAVDRDVFQPRVQGREGSDTILAVLRRSEEGQVLASGAAQLMRSTRGDEDRAFEVNEGDWVPSAEGPSATRPGQPQSPESSDMTLAISELRAELAVLRASHSRLRDRVVALEAAQSGVNLPGARVLRGGRGRRRSEPPPPLGEAENPVAPLAENPGFAATQASPGLGPTPLPAPARGAPPPAATAPRPASFEEMARALGADERPPALALPSLHALNECLQTLMEQAPKMTASAQELPLEALTKPQSCKLLDDDGRERGIIVLDLAASVLLGAGLLALPRDEAERQVREDDASEDTLLATSEICNNLTGPLNAVPGNQHVRSTALVSVDVGTVPKPRARLDLTVDGGNVVLAMF